MTAQSRLIYRATTNKPRGFRAYATKRHDGDSFWVMADTGFDGRAEPELRLVDVTAPEVKPVQLGSAETTNFVNEWLIAAESVKPARRWPLWVVTMQTTAFEPEQKQTFTRYLAWVWRFDQQDDPDATLNRAVAGMLAQHPDWPAGQ